MLKVEGVDMAPALLDSDPGADVDKREVAVGRVTQHRLENPPPGDRGDQHQEPGKGSGAKVAPPPGREPRLAHRSASGTGFRGSGPMYSDCGRMRRLLALCSSTWADQPATRDTAKVGGKYSFGRPIACSTPAE